MPAFYPNHVPDKVDAFTRGYLTCAEWLLDEEIDRDKIRGWSREAIKKAKADCRDFQKANAAMLAAFSEITGRDDESHGHDFLLTRNGHGAGFWDRGGGMPGDALSAASKVYGGVDVYASRGWLHFD